MGTPHAETPPDHEVELTPEFWDLITVPDDYKVGCWIWGGKTFSNGYSRWNAHDRGYSPYRLVYCHYRGPIPDGLEVDHLCQNRLCVNPYHLEAITSAENKARHAAGNTHCPNGHPYTPSNTYKLANGHRRCKTCRAQPQVPKRQAPPAGRPMNTTTKLGHEIHQSGLLLYEVSALCHIAYNRLSLYVNGRREIPADQLNRLSSVLGVPKEDLLGYRPGYEPETADAG